MRTLWLSWLTIGCAGEGASRRDRGGEHGFGGDAERCPPDDPAVDVVSAEQAQVEEMVGDERYLYWADGNDYGLHRVEKETGETETLYVPDGIEIVAGLALDDTFVYFHETSLGPPHRLLRIPKSGGAAERLADLEGFPWAIAADDDAVYSIVGPAFGDQELAAVDKEGGPLRPIANIGGSSFGVAIAEGRAWWTAIDEALSVEVHSVSTGGGSREDHGPTQCQSRLQEGDGDLWCVSLDTVERIDTASGEADVVLQGPYAGTRGFEDAASADGWVYAVGGLTAEGEVRRARSDGSREELVSCRQNFPRAVVVDSEAVWVGNSGGPSAVERTGGIRKIVLP